MGETPMLLHLIVRDTMLPAAATPFNVLFQVSGVSSCTRLSRRDDGGIM
jgi:hypothetical protein